MRGLSTVKLNAVSGADAYPMPRVDDMIDALGKAKYITTLDLARGYWQVPVLEESRPLTAFATPYGLYQFRVMPFGLQGAPATFQRMMDQVLADCSEYAAAYLDDVKNLSSSTLRRCGYATFTVYITDLYGRNGKAGKSSPKSINIRPKRSMIGPRVKNTEDLARQLRKCTGYMLHSFVYPAISSTKFAAFVVRHGAAQKRRVT